MLVKKFIFATNFLRIIEEKKMNNERYLNEIDMENRF